MRLLNCRWVYVAGGLKLICSVFLCSFGEKAVNIICLLEYVVAILGYSDVSSRAFTYE